MPLHDPVSVQPNTRHAQDDTGKVGDDGGGGDGGRHPAYRCGHEAIGHVIPLVRQFGPPSLHVLALVAQSPSLPT